MSADAVVVFKGTDGRWRWTENAPNGRHIATSGEHFATRRNAIRAAKRANPGIRIQAAGWLGR